MVVNPLVHLNKEVVEVQQQLVTVAHLELADMVVQVLQHQFQQAQQLTQVVAEVVAESQADLVGLAVVEQVQLIMRQEELVEPIQVVVAVEMVQLIVQVVQAVQE